MKSPLALITEKFGDKKKLVEAVTKFTTDDLWVNKTNKDKGLAHVSNAKLLRLHTTFSMVKEKFGTRVKLIEAIMVLDKRAKDEGYRTHLSAFPVPRLFDLYSSTAKRHVAADNKAKGVKTPKKVAAPVAKKASIAPKKPAAKSAAKKKK